MRHGKRYVRIANPQPGHATHTSRSAASRYEALGRGQIVGGVFYFFTELDKPADVVRRRWAAPPDPVSGIGLATLEQVQGLPCAGPAVRIFTILTKRGPGRPAERRHL